MAGLIESIQPTLEQDMDEGQTSNLFELFGMSIGLNTLEILCLKSNQALALKLMALNGQNALVDVCNPNLSTQQMLRDAIAATCASGGSFTEARFFDKLGEKFDYIIETESFKSNEKIKCIWDLITDSNTNLFCSTLDNFVSSPEYDLYLYVGNSPGKCAITRDNYPQGEISITFDAACIEDRTIIELAKTILHEGIHAEIFRIVKSIGGYENLRPDNYAEIWEAYRSEKNWSHEFMANWYLNKLASSLAQIDNNAFSNEYYVALAWQGLGENPNNPNDPITIQWGNLTNSEKQNILSLRQELINNSNLTCP